jgi:hypothetical protein
MEIVFISVSVALFVAAFLTMVRIVRDVLSHLDEQDRARLTVGKDLSGLSGSTVRSGKLGRNTPACFRRAANGYYLHGS